MPKPKAKPESQAMARINCRITTSLKEQVEAAAELCGQSITSFTELALAEKTREVLLEQERIQLSQAAFQSFLDIVQAPPAQPSSRLISALESYRRKQP